MNSSHNSDGFDKVKRVLGGGPGEGWVFGVCANVARRTGWELWAVRAVVLVSLLIMSLLTILGYFALAMLMNETRPGAQQKMRRWAGQLDTLFEAVSQGLKRFFDQKSDGHTTDGRRRSNERRDSYWQDYQA
ncbi:MAG: PspC domain-containing protein [Pseudomonadota bacterium]